MDNLLNLYDMESKEPYKRAFDYLHLHYDERYAKRFVMALETAKPVYKRLDDVLRAAQLRMSDLEPLYDELKVDVRENNVDRKIYPVLLVAGTPLFITNGLDNIAKAMVLASGKPLICKVTTGGR